MFAALTLIAFHVGYKTWGSLALGETMAFTALALGQLVHALNVRSSHSLFKSGLLSNRYMIAALLGSCALLLGVLLIPGLQNIFSLIPMSLNAWLVVIGLALAPLVIVEVYKLIRSFLKK